MLFATNSTDYGIKGFYKTIDKGNSWFSIPDPGGNLEFAKHQAWYDLILGVDPNDENIVVCGRLAVMAVERWWEYMVPAGAW
jgi:hypothetical protein